MLTALVIIAVVIEICRLIYELYEKRDLLSLNDAIYLIRERLASLICASMATTIVAFLVEALLIYSGLLIPGVGIVVGGILAGIAAGVVAWHGSKLVMNWLLPRNIAEYKLQFPSSSCTTAKRVAI